MEESTITLDNSIKSEEHILSKEVILKSSL